MNLWLMIWFYLRSRPLNTGLNIFLLGLGIAVVTILLVGSRQLHEKITANSKGIDLVVGAKGSPMQLILCNIFHVDFPTGNINLREAERIASNRLVKKAIPLALGDSYQGYRIIGTVPDYAGLYNARIQDGRIFASSLEVTVGSAVARGLGLWPGASFVSAHGLSGGGHAHEEQEFVVIGVFEETHTVLDNLILTSVESVWQVHGADTAHVPRPIDQTIASPLVPSVARGDSTREITSILIQYRSAMGAIQLPRWVNGQSSLQAASPAFETARLFSILGVGIDVLKAFATILIFISGLSIFIALYNSLKERRYDLAIMRSMGASRTKIFLAVLLEGTSLTFFGTLFGIVLAHTVFAVLAFAIGGMHGSPIAAFIFYPEEGIILGASLLLGVLCALLPAWHAYRTDISKVLASA